MTEIAEGAARAKRGRRRSTRTMWGDRRDELAVVVIPRERFPAQRPVPRGFAFVDRVPRAVERALLASQFEHWEIPYGRRFQGARDDSLIAIAVDGRETVGLVYLAVENELDLRGYGQLHYPLVRSGYRGQGLFRALFDRLVRRASAWELDGFVVVTDRGGHSELYERWGAIAVGSFRSPRRVRRILRGPLHPRRAVARRAAASLRRPEARRSEP